MSNRVVFQIILGCALGIGTAAALCYGLVEFSDWIAEQTHALH
jgi:hypothetical protein